MPRWRATSAVAALMCVSAKPSSAQPASARRRRMGKMENLRPSRRGVVTGGLAGGFVLAFHVPVRAANEPEQAPDSTQGKFAPNAFIRIDHAGTTTLVMPQVEM